MIASALKTQDADAVDEVSLAGARSGDVRAFERLYKQHVGRVYALCLRLTGERALAEDCTQEAFVKAWQELPHFERRSTFGTWLHRIALNTVFARGRRGELDLRASLEDVAESEAPPGDSEYALDDLDKVLRRLPGQARSVVVLYGLYGYEHDEIARLLDTTAGACKVQLHRARKVLRKSLRAEGWS